MKKIFMTVALICAVIFFSSAKTLAAEFELVSYSAHVKLQWLATTGMPEAKKILSELGMANIYSKKNLRDYDRLEKLNGIYQELCYLSTAQYVASKNYRSIIDIGGGYTPRAVVMVNDGRKYLGAELNAVAISAMQVMPKFIKPEFKGNLDYDEVLVEDRSAMLDAVKRVGRPVCIIEDGLMIYLTKERADRMFTIIHDILQQNGGCFITSDFVTEKMFKDIASSIYGETSAQKLFDETKDMYEELFGAPLKMGMFKNEIEAINFLKKKGLTVRQVPLISDPTQLYSLSNLNAYQKASLKKICAKNYLWVITAE